MWLLHKITSKKGEISKRTVSEDSIERTFLVPLIKYKIFGTENLTIHKKRWFNVYCICDTFHETFNYKI